MSVERKQMVAVSYITDTETGAYKLGEVDGAFDKEKLRDYIKSFGHEGLCSHLAFLQFQVWETMLEVNGECCQDYGSKCCDPN